LGFLARSFCLGRLLVDGLVYCESGECWSDGGEAEGKRFVQVFNFGEEVAATGYEVLGCWVRGQVYFGWRDVVG